MSKYLTRVKLEYLNKLKTFLPPYITIDEHNYTHSHAKARFIDSSYGEWWALPINVEKGSEHPDRGKIKSSNSRILKTISKYGLPEGVSMDISTFKGLNKKARFIDSRYGEWWTTASCVLKKGTGHPKKAAEKRKATLKQRYGVDYTMQNKSFFDKSMISQQRSEKAIHWRTNVELICTGSYEIFVVDYLNKNKIDFCWQSKNFQMPDGRTYRPDMFLVNENKWIEIKGYFWKDAREKWEWFNSVFTNSEIWDLDYLEKIGYSRKRKKGVK